MSIALYRKYRSATFGDLIGQAHIATTLRNQVRSGELAHAYLFTGIRGTGKTSTARILARAVTCLEPHEGEPCNRCTACGEVLSGAAVDVLEIDAASNRGIDEMRDLRERVKFLPASLRRKVYIVDEAHMLTPEAWNAFLKTLEEPPPHVLFVLATTEPHKVPETVRSRVQRFDFRRVDRSAVAAHLARIAADEGALVEAEAVELLAQAGQGSVRDALSLLDQALAAGERPLGVGVVRRALGLADPAVLRDLMLAVASGQTATALRAVQAAFDGGADARQLLREMARLARGAEYCSLGFAEGADAVGEEAALHAELAAVAGDRPGLFITVIERCAEAEINLRQPVDARLQVELVLLRVTQAGRGSPPAEPGSGADVLAGLLRRVDALEARAGRPSIAPAPGATPTIPEAPGGPERRGGLPGPSLPVAGPPDPASAGAGASHERAPGRGDGPERTVTAAGLPPIPDLAGWTAVFAELIDRVNRRDPMLAGVLRSCRPVDGEPARVVIGAPFGFHLERLQDRQKAPILAEAAAAVAGRPVSVEAIFVGEGDKPGGRPSGTAAEGPDTTAAVLSAFPGSRITGSRLREPSPDRPTWGRGPREP